MARSIPQSQLLRFRSVLTYFYLSVGCAQLIAAFVLMWFGKNGAFGFLATGIFTACWASIVATSETVSSKDLAIVRKLTR
jgi:hypothetical protein